MSDISTLHNVIEGKKRLVRFLHARVPEDPAMPGYANSIDGAIFSAAETLVSAEAFAQVDYRWVPQDQKRRVLADKMLETSPLLRKYHSEGRFTIEGLAEACHGILTSAICLLKTRPGLKTTGITNVTLQGNEDADSYCTLVSWKRVQDSHGEHVNSKASPAMTNTTQTPLEEQNLPTAEQPKLAITCSLHLFSKIQAGDRFASVAHTFATTSSLLDITNVLVDYGVISPKDEMPKMILFFKGIAVSVEYDKSLQSHLAAAYAERAPVVIFVEDRPDGSQGSREELLVRFFGARM
jgi:hypothetical protein